jgi:ribonuclease BN (tRNA processing enzyme)
MTVAARLPTAHAPVQVRFLGSGDAFGSGGRLNTCIQVRCGGGSFLIDCGASAMVSMRKFAVEPNTISSILITHLHGDHFGGLPFFILDAQLVSRRTRPLTIAGPAGLEERLRVLMEAMFPGSSTARRSFDVEIKELTCGRSQTVDGELQLVVLAHKVQHPSGNDALALRVSVEDKILAYTGDTGWVDALVEVAEDSDLLIAEAYTAEPKAPYHLDFATLRAKLPMLRTRRLVVTHMSSGMLRQTATLPCEAAFDGMEIAIQ